MKRHNTLFIIFIMIIITLILTFAGCQKSRSSAVDVKETSESAAELTTELTAEVTAAELKTFTKEELAKYTGKDGSRAYIAIDGKVYDVTDVPQWKSGSHADGKFEAGKDFTNELKNLAPHNASKMDGVPVVGTLID